MSVQKSNVSLEKNPTIPPINLLKEKQLDFLNQVRLLHRNRPEGKIVDFHKTHLNKQHYTFKGSDCIYYVWERFFQSPDNGQYIGWRVFVNNKKGICFEVTPNCKLEDVQFCWMDYLGTIDLLGVFKPLT